jgi:ATP-dependent Clp protease, protease subunit
VSWRHETRFERRIVLVTGHLDELLATRVAAELMSLDAAGAEPIEVHVDSRDGVLEAALVLIDTLDGLRAAVRAHCRGEAGGPAVGVLAVAGHRSAAAHARFRLAQPTVRFAGTPEEVAARTRQHRDLLVRFQSRLARATGRPVDDVVDDMRRGRYLDAGEARDYGLIDTIVGPAR